jgi:D-glycero-alpha-D-manno-heptose 1-phosphate guanylyltransferase
MNGDTWFEPDFKAFPKAAEGSDFCIAAAQVPDASRYGTLEWDADGRLISFKEKADSPASGSINAGVYFVSQKLLASLRIEPLSLERAFLPELTRERHVKVLPSDAPFLDIGIPSDYAAAVGFFERLGMAPNPMCPDLPPH